MGPAASDEQHFGPFSAAGFTSWPPHAQIQFAELDAHNSIDRTNCYIMWKKKETLQEMQAACTNTLVQHLGIEFTQIGPDYIEARMPVDHRTKQPLGLLHGGASAAFAETLGGAGAYLATEYGSVCVGVEINANHIRSVKEGWVIGHATALHLGRTTQVWDIKIRDNKDTLVCIARLTVAVR